MYMCNSSEELNLRENRLRSKHLDGNEEKEGRKEKRGEIEVGEESKVKVRSWHA